MLANKYACPDREIPAQECSPLFGHIPAFFMAPVIGKEFDRDAANCGQHKSLKICAKQIRPKPQDPGSRKTRLSWQKSDAKMLMQAKQV